MREYSYRTTKGAYEIGYWEDGEFIVVATVDSLEDVLTFIADNDIG